jgi:hypothetical protein
MRRAAGERFAVRASSSGPLPSRIRSARRSLVVRQPVDAVLFVDLRQMRGQLLDELGIRRPAAQTRDTFADDLDPVHGNPRITPV